MQEADEAKMSKMLHPQTVEKRRAAKMPSSKPELGKRLRLLFRAPLDAWEQEDCAVMFNALRSEHGQTALVHTQSGVSNVKRYVIFTLTYCS